MPLSLAILNLLLLLLFCQSCGKYLSANQSSAKNHLRSVKHLAVQPKPRSVANASKVSQQQREETTLVTSTKSTTTSVSKVLPTKNVGKKSTVPIVSHMSEVDAGYTNEFDTEHLITKRSTNIYVQHTKNPDGKGTEKADIHLIGWEWKEVGVFIMFAIFVFTVGYAKVAFHHTHFLEAYFPESFLMLLLGAAVGFVLYVLGFRMPLEMDIAKPEPPHSYSYQYYFYQQQIDDVESAAVNDQKEGEFTFPKFSPRLYFLILIPPIILEQSYALYDSEFAESLYPIMLFSIMGKLITTSTIGPLLHMLSVFKVFPSLPSEKNSHPLLSLTDSLVFSSIISAVDPVPVLGLLHEAGVNKQLYFLIFGESLLNDAVSVSLYSTMVAFTGPVQVLESHYGMAVLAFIVKSLGGFIIGVIFGLISALATRTTEHHRTVEPLTLLGLAYISYLLAEVVHFSGHICLIGCGLLQAHYAFQNISFTSYNSIIHFIKMLSSTSDAVILIFLGMAMVNYAHVWHTGFILWTLLLCFLCRVFGVYFLALIHNATSSRWINFRNQTVLAYCGLRGALCLCMAHMLNETRVPQKSLFVTTTLVVILFTTLVQGGTIKLLLSCLRIQKKDKHEGETLNEAIADSAFSLALCGVEAIAQMRGNGYIKRTLEKFDEKYLKKIFLSTNADHELQRMYHKLALEGPISSRVPSGNRVSSHYETMLMQGTSGGNRRFYHMEQPWNQQRRINRHRPFRVEGRKNVKFKESEIDMQMVHAHFEENQANQPILIELHDVIPSAAINNRQKLFIAHVRKTSAEERLREVILERTQKIDIPAVKEAFTQNKE